MGREKAKRGKSRWTDLPNGAAFVLAHAFLIHPNYVRMSAYAKALLVDLGSQYTGFNNGYLCASWSAMSKRSWNSSHTLRNAMLELEHYGWIIRTQQGDRTNKPTLHAFTFRRIDRIEGRPPLLLGPSDNPLNSWSEPREKFVRPARDAADADDVGAPGAHQPLPEAA